MFKSRKADMVSLPVRLIVAMVVALAVAAGLASVGVASAGAATIPGPAKSCPASNYAQIDGRCLKITQTKNLTATAGAAFEKAFSTPAGQAALGKVLTKLDGAKVGFVQASPSRSARPHWACPGGVSCGVSSTGGTHFWVIASYAAVLSVGTGAFWIDCTGALSPVIDPVAAAAACGVVSGVMWALVNNVPATTHHGVWLAIYRNYWTDGLW